MAISIRTDDLTEADLDAALDIQNRAFGQMSDDWLDEWRRRTTALIEAGRVVGVRDGDRLVAHARLRPFRQYWGGRSLPMAGIAAVVVAPDYRGRGVGTLLMQSVVQRGVEVGDVVSALYPATIPLYRRLGWEVTGSQYRVSIDAAALRALGQGAADVRRVEERDLDDVLDHVRRHWSTLGASGPKELDADTTRYSLADPKLYCYRTDDGLLMYAWAKGEFVVHHLTAGSEQSARALWSLVGSGSSVAKTVHAYVSPHDPVHLLLPDTASSETRQERWMFRLLDAPAAFEGRGYPTGARLEVPLTIADPLAAGSDGSWVLRISDGKGGLERTSPTPNALRLGPNGLAALYAGTPLATLRLAGLAEGGRADDDTSLDAAFVATPFLLEYF
ncbi:MAG TPA: GNAT family N-acetyltransferase [Nocardioidaceae bacterium]|nr:GNAT family N-acetyltransferase [Nocardioidaceae bacterium]